MVKMRGIRSLQRQRGLAVLGSLCLVLQLAVCSPLLPLATALIAWMDGGHSIRFVVSGDETHVELRHEHGVLGRELNHQHTPLLRSMMCFSKRSTSVQGDHILEFSTTGSVSEFRSLTERATRVEAELQEGCARWSSNAFEQRESMQILAGVHPERSRVFPESVLLHASTSSSGVELAGTVMLTI
jgi:hypothetical protein